LGFQVLYSDPPPLPPFCFVVFFLCVGDGEREAPERSIPFVVIFPSFVPLWGRTRTIKITIPPLLLPLSLDASAVNPASSPPSPSAHYLVKYGKSIAPWNTPPPFLFISPSLSTRNLTSAVEPLPSFPILVSPESLRVSEKNGCSNYYG